MTETNNNPELGKGNDASNIVSALKGNPKALYGLIGAIAIVTLGLALFGGNESKVTVNAVFSKGQTVVLENPNGGLSHVTAAPGMMGAQTAEEDVEQDICVANPGTHGTVEDEQVTGLLPYIKVAITDGPCQGKSGWTSKVNVKGQ